MPPLSNLNIAHHGAPMQSPPASAYQPAQHSHYPSPMSPQHMPPQQAPRHGMPNPTAAASAIQSWGEPVQQPQPMQPPANPMGGMWSQGMGIKFGGSGPPPPPPSGAGQGQQGQQDASGTWNPNSGIKFG